VSATRVGDRIAEGERRRVLERLVSLPNYAEHGARIAPHVRDVARHRYAQRPVLALDDRFQRVLLD
jgi:hypothetical protein